MRPALLLGLLLTLPAFAGCITLEDNPDGSSPVRTVSKPPTFAPPAKGNMTGEEVNKQTSSAACGGVTLPPQQVYCAKQIIWIEGTISGLSELPVTLNTFVGDLNVRGVEGNKWNLTVTLGARGDSDAASRQNLNNIDFQWSHKKDPGHALSSIAKKKDQQVNNQESAAMDLSIPKDLSLFLAESNAVGTVKATGIKASQCSLSTASGDVEVSDVHAVWLFLHSASGSVAATDFVAQELAIDTASGDVNAKGEATQAHVGAASATLVVDLKAASVSMNTASGNIDATITPSATGAISLSAASGNLELAVPEGPNHGYTVDGDSSSGTVTIGLKDGTVTGEEDSKHFATTGYGKRTIRTSVDLSTASGNIDVEPAA